MNIKYFMGMMEQKKEGMFIWKKYNIIYMKILYKEKGKGICNYYGDMIHSLSINNKILVQGNMKHENILQKIKEFNPDIVLVGFTITDTGGDPPKLNLNNIELEKQKISNKIKELNNTITGKSNIISSPIIKESPVDARKDISNLNDKEQKSLDEVINRIFAKI